jgi:predicted phosphodiesterase
MNEETITTDTAKIVAISCSHSPFASVEAHGRLLDLLSNEANSITHFVHCGDLLEAAAASVHADEHGHTLADEFRHASAYLESIRKVLSPKARLYWLWGNHDDNIFKKDPRRIPQALREMIELGRDNKWPEFQKWTQLPYTKSKRGVLQIGQVCFYHGFDAGATSDELEALQMSNITGGHSHRLFVRGHTHRPIPPTQAMRTRKIPLPWWYANVGTMGPLEPDWASRVDRSQWGAAALIVETKTNRPHRLCSRQWDAQLLNL